MWKSLSPRSTEPAGVDAKPFEARPQGGGLCPQAFGGGAGGLSVAEGAARLGAKVAVVEKEKLGGDCLYRGCVPSRTIIRTAKAGYETREAGEFGVLTDNIRINYPRVRERLADIIGKQRKQKEVTEK